MDSKTFLSSAVAFRLVSHLGVLNKEMPSIKVDAYKQPDETQNIWCARVPLDDQSEIVVMYSEDPNDSIRYMATTLVTTSHDKAIAPWHLIVLGDDECKENDQNRVMIQINDEGAPRFTESSIVDMFSLVKGFEILRDYSPRMLPIKFSNELIKQFKSFISSLPFEETES